MSFTSETVQLGTSDAHPMTNWNGIKILDALVAELPAPGTDWQQKSLAAIQAGDYSLCKVYPTVALGDAFVKAIGYMSSIPTVTSKKMPTLATLVTESCRAIADAHRDLSLETDTAWTDNGVSKAKRVRQEKLLKLEKINKDIFAKILGD